MLVMRCYSLKPGMQSLGTGHGSDWATLSVVCLWSIQVEMSNRQLDVR